MRLASPTGRTAALLVLLVPSACGGSRPIAVTPAAPRTIVSPVEILQKDLAAIFDAPQFERSLWSVLVRPVSGGDPLFARNAEKLAMPGSNMKIVTVAAAAEQLGWAHRFETRLVTTASLESGILRGDLIVVGGGDPSVSERSDEPGILRSMARQLRAAGIIGIEGRIIGDDDRFDDKGFGDGWTMDNLPYGYSAPVSALEYNEGSVDLVLRAGAAAGEPVVIQVRPEGSGLEIENRLVTVSEQGTGMLTMHRPPGSSRVVVEGQIPAKAEPFVRTASVDNPTAFFVAAFRAAVMAEGVDVVGDAVDIDTLASKPDLTNARTIGVRQSPPLSELATSMMKVSQNQYAEMLLKAIGGGTSEGGRRKVQEVLRTWAIPDDSYIVADGSGLSRYNYVSAETLVRILQILHERPTHASIFPATLPVAGRDGSLARRLVATPAQGNVRAKTGTVDNARAISGYVRTGDGDTLAFSIIANNFSLASGEIDAAADRALIRLATFTRRP
jgi:D-alanyl-D-alanine carboxypeptidase/D-alanyl-D-alanine-endopeptidase (penicillin-binding protein 4)